MRTIELPWETWRAVIAVLREKALPSMLEHADHLERQREQHPPGQATVILHRTDGLAASKHGRRSRNRRAGGARPVAAWAGETLWYDSGHHTIPWGPRARHAAPGSSGRSQPMRRMPTAGRFVSCTVVALVEALVFAGGGFGVTVEPVEAAFPGKNGRIAFASDRVTAANPTGDFEIFTMNPDGTNVKQLTKNIANDHDPAWSADGKKIAYRSDRDGNEEIYTMKADGSGQARRTINLLIDFDPAWSPNGKQIAFARTVEGNSDIYTMRADGTNQTRRTNHAASDSAPAWSPNGKKIAFVSRRDGNSEIYTMAANGGSQTRRTTNAALDFAPDWQPKPP